MDLPEIIGGKYRPRSVLGLGATGTVYCVEHTFTGDLLALKVLQPHLSASPEALARFKGEARTAAKLRSRHVVRIFDADVARELGNAPYLVMELLEGSNLEQAIGDKSVAPAMVVNWLRQAAVPLDRAHGLGIVHRDLKPENIFLTKTEDGTPLVKILDFGIARIAESPGMTKSGQLFGTPLYMAPEQARGEPDQIGPATDIFALGLIAYKLLTGAEYRAEAGLGQMLHEILNAPLQTPSQKGHSLGDGFDAWFLRACDSDPRRRFASVREQVEALADAFGLPEESSLVGGPPSSGKSSEARASWVVPLSDAEVRLSPQRASAPGSLRATTIDRVAGHPKLDAIPTLSGADVEEISARPNGWRLGFFAVGAMFIVALGTAVWLRGAAGVHASVSPPGCVTASLGAGPTPNVQDVAVPPAISMAAASAAPVPTPDAAKPTTTAMRLWAPAPLRAAATMPRAITAPAASARKRPDDDPLSDQK